MSLKHTFGIGFALALGLAGCGSSTASNTQMLSMNQIANSGQQGTATLLDTGDGNTTVTLATAGGGDSGMQAAHIHTGVCGSGGPVLQGLTSVNQGASVTVVKYTLATLAGGNHYINIHKSTDPNIIMSCGQIQ